MTKWNVPDDYVLRRIHDIFTEVAEIASLTDMTEDEAAGVPMAVFTAENYMLSAWKSYLASLSEPDNLKQTNNGKETDRGPGLSGSDSEAVPCKNCICGGIPFDERFVTHDMALNAGMPESEGFSLGVEYGQCPCCLGVYQDCDNCRKESEAGDLRIAEVEYHVYECGHGEIAVKGGQYHPLCPKCDDAMADGKLDEDGRFQKWLRRRQCQSK